MEQLSQKTKDHTARNQSFRHLGDHYKLHSLPQTGIQLVLSQELDNRCWNRARLFSVSNPKDNERELIRVGE